MILGQLDGSLFLKHLFGCKKSTPNGSRRDLRVRGVCIPFLVSLNKWMDTASFLVLALYSDVLHCASNILTHFCTLIHVMVSPGKLTPFKNSLTIFVLWPQELQLMIKGLVGGLRTLVLAFALLFVVLYIIAVFATITIGRGPELDGTLRNLFRCGWEFRSWVSCAKMTDSGTVYRQFLINERPTDLKAHVTFTSHWHRPYIFGGF